MMPRRRQSARLPLGLGCVLSVVVLVGCHSDDPLTQFNSWANVRFDGYVVGRADDVSGQAISCERETDDGPVTQLVDAGRWPDDPSEWLVLGSGAGEAYVGTEVDMNLWLQTADRETNVELVVGEGVYRSDDTTEVRLIGRSGDRGLYRDDTGEKVRIDGLVGGRAVFRGVPLHRGEPFHDKPRLDRLVIEWDCLGRPDIWGARRRAE